MLADQQLLRSNKTLRSAAAEANYEHIITPTFAIFHPQSIAAGFARDLFRKCGKTLPTLTTFWQPRILVFFFSLFR